MRRLLAALTVAAGLPVLALAQTADTTNMDILRQKIKADRKLVVAENLQLTDAEGAKFWPVYDAYQKELQQINDRLYAVILAYAEAYKKGPVTDAAAKKLPADHPDQAFYTGKKFAAQYFAANVLPLVAAKGALLGREDRTALEIPQAAFATI